MIITLEQLENAEGQSININFLETILDINSNKAVKAQLTIWKKGTHVEVLGDIEAEVEIECDRCLKKFNQVLNIDIKEVFSTCEAFDYSHNEIELKNDNFVVELEKEGEIDITDLVYQSIILNLPSKKICSENCEGTEVLKELQSNKIDPRLAVFQDISQKISKKEGK
ncbi:MAG: DUF177 domain-containing protein [bacterium]